MIAWAILAKLESIRSTRDSSRCSQTPTPAGDGILYIHGVYDMYPTQIGGKIWFLILYQAETSLNGCNVVLHFTIKYLFTSIPNLVWVFCEEHLAWLYFTHTFVIFSVTILLLPAEVMCYSSVHCFSEVRYCSVLGIT